MPRLLCPATAANLGPGFDALGIAFDRANVFEVEPADAFELSASGAEAHLVPRDPARHAVVRAYQAARAALGLQPASGLRVHAEVWAPPARGLGSSATATAAGILAAEAIAGLELPRADRLQLATRLEGHPDNVVPCLLGGLCISVEGEAGLVAERFELPAPPAFVAVVPRGVELSTETMRAALPPLLSHEDAVASAGRAALLTALLVSGRSDPNSLRTALADRLHEPYRGPQIPGFAEVRAAGLEAGAIGVVISGSGPTLLALTRPEDTQPVARAMLDAWGALQIEAAAHVLGIDLQGARVAAG